MSSAAPFTVALDAPSDTGKSTLAQALRDALDAEVFVLPCYADLAGSEPPLARGEDIKEQLASLEFYLAVDRERQAMMDGAGPETIVIADRSPVGLLAHVYAIEHTGGPAAYQQAQALISEQATELLAPELILYLALDAESRRSRREPADEDAWFVSEALNEQIDRFFTSEAPGLLPGVVERLDAAPAASEILQLARQIVLERRLATA